MTKYLRIIAWVAIARGITLGGGMVTWAQEQPGDSAVPGALRVAVIDIDLVGQEYQALQQKGEELERWMTKQMTDLQRLVDFAYLSETNFQEVLQLLELSPPLPAGKQVRLDELESLSSQKEQRFLELRANPSRSPEEEEEFNPLREISATRQEQLQQREQQIIADYQEKRRVADEVLMRTVEETVAEYAEATGYDLVLDKTVVLYGGEDITRRIIEKLNPPAASEGASEETPE